MFSHQGLQTITERGEYKLVSVLLRNAKWSEIE